MGATKLLILENSLGQKVRTLAVHEDVFNLVYIQSNRRIEAVVDLADLKDEDIEFQLIKKIELNKIPQNGVAVKDFGRIKLLEEGSYSNSPTYMLPAEDDEVNLNMILKKTAIAHVAVALLLGLGSWITAKYFQDKKDETLVTIVVPKPPAPKVSEKVHRVKVSQKKVKPSKKVYRPLVAKKKLKTKPIKARQAKKAVDVQRIGALAALGGLPSGKKGYEGLDRNSIKNIRAAGIGSGGGGIGSAGRGGVKGYMPGTGLIAGSAGSEGKATSAGGYGTRGTGGGKAGYGKISIVGGQSAVSLPLDDEATVEGGLDRDQIIAVINRNRGQIIYCYEQGLQKQPTIGGRVAVSFVIGPNGRVTTANVAQSSLQSQRVESCIVGRMKTWKFPRPVGNVSVDVLYPFELMRVSSR